MNALPPPPKVVPPRPVNPQDDAFDDTYAWVGYESAQPLSLSSEDRTVWAGAVEHRN